MSSKDRAAQGPLPQGTLIIIGGAEDKRNECEILRTVVGTAGGGDSRLVVLTAATEQPQTVGAEYHHVFRQLGAGGVQLLHVNDRAIANQEATACMIEQATGIFLTGGDQLRITSIIGGTSLDRALLRAYHQGAVIAGTSAGASAMSSTMIVAGSEENAPTRNTLNMAPGMGLLRDVVIDQHFAQRGRIGRLLSAIAQNPHALGVGIDEDTAIVVHPDRTFTVVGTNAVTVIDGNSITDINATETSPTMPLALTDVTLHMLPVGYGFDLDRRRPLAPSDEPRPRPQRQREADA
jgi:cyanophycinase